MDWKRRSARLLGGDVDFTAVRAVVADHLGVRAESIRPMTEDVGAEVMRLGVYPGPSHVFGTEVRFTVREDVTAFSSSAELARVLAKGLQRDVLANLEREEWSPGLYILAKPNGKLFVVEEGEEDNPRGPSISSAYEYIPKCGKPYLAKCNPALPAAKPVKRLKAKGSNVR